MSRVQTYVDRGKNYSGCYTGQVDFEETQIQVFAKTKKEVKRMLSAARKIIRPPKK